MKQTPNIGLTEIGSSYIDKDVDLEEWRLLIAGEDSSNMSIIDKEVGDLKKIIKKDGNGQKYLSDDGTYRYVSGGGGLTRVAFASDSYLVYTAMSDTTIFTISNMSTSKSVELIKDNMVMMQGQEYNIDKSTGIVTLSFTLKSGEKIYYNVVEGEEKAILHSDTGMVETNREKYLTDINGNFIAPRTTISAVDGLSGNISSVAQQINVLNGDRGYLNSKDITGTNIDTLLQNGKYTGVPTGTLPSNIYPNHTINLDVTSGNYNYTTQKLTAPITPTGLATWFRFYNPNVAHEWSEWQQIATVSQIQAMIDASLM